MKQIKAKHVLLAALLGLVLVLDRLSKNWAASFLAVTDGVTVIPGFLGWRYAENRGVAFSAFSGAGTVLCVFTALVIAAVFIWLIRRPKRGGWLTWGGFLAITGGVSNLYDRIRFGYVIDFIEFLFVRFAIFNVADIAVVCGVICMAIGILRSEDSRR